MRSIQDSFSQDVYDAIDRILGSDVLENEKQDLLDSILFIFHQQAKEIKNELLPNENWNNDIFLQNRSSNFINPSINIYLINPYANLSPIQNNINSQSSITPVFPSNWFCYNYPQIQYPITQLPSYQQSVLNYNNFLPNTNELLPLTYNDPKKKSHKKSGHHEKHAKTKNKKDKKDKKDSKSKKSKDKKDKDKKDSKFNIQTFVLQNQRNFDGIFNYLTSKTGGNISDNGTIEVSSNSINRIQSHPKNLLQESGNYAAESSKKDAYVIFDFKKMKVEITDYTIKASATCCMKNWVFEVSNDGIDWKIIDQHINCLDLQTPNALRSFKVQKNGFSRFCRIRHNGEFIDYHIGNVMIINRVEFYGKLKSQFT